MRFSVIRKANNMKDKRILSGQTAYVFTEYNDGIEMTDWQGFITCADDIVELCYGLIKYAVKYKSEIDVYNQKRMIELEEELREAKADMFICLNVVENTKSDFLKMLKGEYIS